MNVFTLRIAEFFQYERKRFATIKFNDEVTGSQSGQTDLRLTASKNGKVLGWIDYTDFHGEISIKMVEVNLEHRGKGIGEKLVLELQRLNPKVEIGWGMLTGPGVGLRRKVKSKLFVDRERINKRQRLEKELKELQAEEKSLTRKLDHVKDDRDKVETIGDRFNEISDRMYEVEEALR